MSDMSFRTLKKKKKNRLHTKKICEGEFLFCEGAKVEKLEEEI